MQIGIIDHGDVRQVAVTRCDVGSDQRGNAFLLNAIGAAFIGTTLSREGRPNVAGTFVGVLLLAILANGLLLTGISFYWQQVATGLLILVVLAASARRIAA